MRIAPVLILTLVACNKAEPDGVSADPILLQAIGGAMLANPDVHAQIPVRVAFEGTAESVIVAGPGGEAEAFLDEEGVYVAWLPTGTESGAVTVDVTAPDGEFTASAELVVSTEGVQLTDKGVEGIATTPALLRDGGALWGSWCDKREDLGSCWARELDGAGRWQGEAFRTVPSTEAVLYARTASGGGDLAVLYQLPEGLPYVNRVRIIDFEGTEVVAPIDVHEDGWQGTFGGDITYDGEGFGLVWRERSTTTSDSRIRWMHLASDGGTTGPVTVASSGDGAPIGSFPPFGFVELAVRDGATLVTWVQDDYSVPLEISVPKAQFAVIDASGAELSRGFLGDRAGFDWDQEAHAGVANGELTAVWTADDLGSLESPIPTEIAVRTFSPTGDASQLRASVEQAPVTRGEPVLFDHPRHSGVVAWIDHRTYTEEGVADGRIELQVASLSDSLQARPALIYPHARFFAGLTDLGGVFADHNVLLTWRDQRHDTSASEMWFETAWIAP